MSGAASPGPARGGPSFLRSFGEIERIVLLSTGFVLVPVEVPGPDLARALGEWLAAAGHSTLLLEPLDDDAWAKLAWQLTTTTPGPGEVVMVIGGRDPSTGMDRGLHLVNQSRDTIAARIGRPLLWCGPRPFLERTMDEAPDFWSIRAVERRLGPDPLAAGEEPTRGAPPPAPSPRPTVEPAPVPSAGDARPSKATPGALEAPGHPDLRTRLDLVEKELARDELNAARLSRPVIEELLARNDILGAHAVHEMVFTPTIRTLEDPVRGDLAILRAEILHREGSPGEAMSILESVLASPATRDDQRVRARLVLAEVRDARGDAARAEEAYREALAGARAARDGAAEARALVGLGSLAMKANPLDAAALAMLEEADSLAQKLGDPGVRALTRPALAEAYTAAYDERRAKELLEPPGPRDGKGPRS